MFSIILRDLLLFVAALAGLALPAWRWLGRAQGAERLSLALAAALLAGYLAGLGLYVAGLPLRWFWVLPVAGLLDVLRRPAVFAGLGRDAEVRGLVGRWLLLALWCLGWQGLIVSYTGGAWGGDWVEHYDRVHFYLQRWPTGHLFLGYYPLPARPPLANLWLAGLMSWAGGSFTHYQVLSTLLSSLVIFPLTVLLGSWRTGGRAANLLLVLLMLSPFFVQNATFPWTKLAAAFFVLLAITQLSPGAGAPAGARLVAGAVLLAGGMLAHYSAGPWICGLGAAHAWFHRDRWRDRAFQKQILLAAVAAGLLLATWFGWALAVYGPATTFLGNTTFALTPVDTPAARVGNAAANLWFTLSPVAANTEVPTLIQCSLLAQLRDNWFLFLQLKLLFVFGSTGAAVMLWQLFRLRWSREAGYWLVALPVIVVLGMATHSVVDRLGLMHIALQPLVLLGLAWLAARADRLPRWLARVWMAGLALDFCLGILLHFLVQSLWIERWLRPGLSTSQYLADYDWAARANWLSKINLHLTFLADVVPPAACVVLLVGTGLIAGALLGRRAAVPPPN